jgi:putative acetyltransferase
VTITSEKRNSGMDCRVRGTPPRKRGGDPMPGNDEGAISAAFSLRPYGPSDEDAAIALWLRTWQAAYPQIDFAARLEWWRARWCKELAPSAVIVIAEQANADGVTMIGFVTVDPRTRYLDQIVVAPESWGSGAAATLLERAKLLSPAGIDLDVNTDNARAIRFYQKHGFVTVAEDVNPRSGAPIYRMRWQS